MADDPTLDTASAAPAASVAPVPPEAVPPAQLQLTQARVPLDEAGEAFTVPDASGRLPIVVLPSQPFRIRNGFVLARRDRDRACAAVRDQHRGPRRAARGRRGRHLPRRLPVVHRARAGRRARAAAQGRSLQPDARCGPPYRPALDRRFARRDRAGDPVRYAGLGGLDQRRRAGRCRRAPHLHDHRPGAVRLRDLGARFRPGVPGLGARCRPHARAVEALRRDPRPLERRHGLAAGRDRCGPRAIWRRGPSAS